MHVCNQELNSKLETNLDSMRPCLKTKFKKRKTEKTIHKLKSESKHWCESSAAVPPLIFMVC